MSGMGGLEGMTTSWEKKIKKGFVLNFSEKTIVSMKVRQKDYEDRSCSRTRFLSAFKLLASLQ